MAKSTNIEWCDHTFNPWIGCTGVSPGCDNCYAEAMMDKRLHKVQWGPKQARVRTSESNWRQPLKWNAEHEKFYAEHGRRQRVFCASLADVFDNEVPEQWRIQLFDLIYATPNLDWLLLTKRIGNVATMLPHYSQKNYMNWGEGYPNVWLGISVVNQQEADRDIPKLLATPAAIRFLSMEPLLGPVDIGLLGIIQKDISPKYTPVHERLNWVIAGGESGHNARPMHPDWVRSLRDQCQDAGVPFLFKQWGEHSLVYDRDRSDPDHNRCGEINRRAGRWINLSGGYGFNGERVHFAERVGKKVAGRLLDGVEHNEYPR